MTPVEQAKAFIAAYEAERDDGAFTSIYRAQASEIMQALLRHIDANEAIYRVRTASLDEALAVIADGGIPGQLSFIEEDQ
jgi:hypothetical protein